MAVKTIEGLGGSATSPTGWNLKIQGWSAQYSIATEETTGFSDGGHEVHEPVSDRWEGSLTGVAVFDDTNAAPIPADLVDGAGMAVDDLQDHAKLALTLQAKDGCTWAGTAVITGLSMDRQAKGKAGVTLSFLGSGALTQTWDETA